MGTPVPYIRHTARPNSCIDGVRDRRSAGTPFLRLAPWGFRLERRLPRPGGLPLRSCTGSTDRHRQPGPCRAWAAPFRIRTANAQVDGVLPLNRSASATRKASPPGCDVVSAAAACRLRTAPVGEGSAGSRRTEVAPGIGSRRDQRQCGRLRVVENGMASASSTYLPLQQGQQRARVGAGRDVDGDEVFPVPFAEQP
jgi:hypothetical protein